MKLPIHFEATAAVQVTLGTMTLSKMVARAITTARAAQKMWAATPVPQRLKILRHVRSLIAEQAESLALAANANRNRPLAEILTAEVLPLAEACRFLERDAQKLLQPKRLGLRGRPFWLGRVHSEIRREPHGLVLVIGPANYPLFLPCVQALQALAAGNAVLMKPGFGGTLAATAFAKILVQAGLEPELFPVLAEAPEAASCAIECGVDKVVLTGSATTGAAVLQQCAKMLTPATVELSGCDAVFVRADADLDLVVRALAFGLRLNNSATCIAPRRVFVHRSRATELEGWLAKMFQGDGGDISGLTNPHWSQLVTEALSGGAHLLAGDVQPDGSLHTPIIFAGMKPCMRLVQEDLFAPVLSLINVADDDEALAIATHCPFALGATIFSRDESAARALANHVRAGVVIINDMIVPTADPRLPFSGRGRSGFGVTRGAEGLLEMTAPKVITVRRGTSRRHFEASHSADSELFAAYIQAAHSRGLSNRLAALKSLFYSLKQRSTKSDQA